MKIIIDGVEYIPKPEPEPAWNNGAIAGAFLDKALEVLKREPNEWTSGTLDVINRTAAYHTAFSALKWYRAEVERLNALIVEADSASR